MSERAQKTEPEIEMVDDAFWLKLSTVLIQGSPEKLDKGAERVATALAWFWTVYAGASSVFLVYLQDSITLLQNVLIIAPVLILFVAYAYATWATLPVDFTFNVISPENIKAVHEELVRIKRRRLLVSMILTGITVVMISVAMISSGMKPGMPSSLAIALGGTDQHPEVIVKGKAPDKTIVVIRITPAGFPTGRQLATANRQNRYIIVIPVQRAAQYLVEVSWQENEQQTTLRETILNKNMADGPQP